MRLVIDLEADGLLYEAKQVWCIVAYDMYRKCYYVYTSEQIGIAMHLDDKKFVTLQEALHLLTSADELILHNGLAYDLPLLEKLYSIDVYPLIDRVFDTYVASSLFNPDRDGGHSLGAWGERLGFAKGEYSDWSKYTDEMLEYCIRDVDVTKKVYDELQREMEAVA